MEIAVSPRPVGATPGRTGSGKPIAGFPSTWIGFEEVRVNTSAVETARAKLGDATHGEKRMEVAWLLRADLRQDLTRSLARTRKKGAANVCQRTAAGGREL